jgi:hypothetical protein
MNAPSTAIATIENRIDKSITTAMSAGAAGINFSNATEIMEYAKMMSVSGSAVPKHLRGQPGACLGIVDDAIRFEMSPYALARKSYFVNDNLAYEAQVLAAIVLARAPLKKRPDIEFTGEGAARKCKVTYTFTDGDVKVYESPAFGSITPKNSPLWKSDPDQQHAYYSLRAGARRFFSDVLLGIYDVEEMGAIKDVTPQQGTGLAARLSGAQGGFNAETIEPAIGEAQDGGNSDGGTSVPAEEERPSASSAAAATEHREPDLIEARKQGQRAAFAGEERVPPEDALPEEKDAWLEAYAEAEADAERVA